MKEMPILPILCFWCGGLLLCWFGGFAKSRYQYSIFSDVVLRGMLLCFGISLGLAVALARRKLHVYWRGVSFAFLLMSMGVSGHFYIGSHAVSTLVRALKR